MALRMGFKRRTSACVCSGCVLFLVLVIVQQCGGKECVADSTILRSMDEQVNYSTANLTLNYTSSTTVNAKAMEQLYFVTNFFIDLIQKKDIFPKDLLEIEDGKINTSKLTTEWSSVLEHYAGIVSVAGIGILFAILMPLVAMFFCCCRCAGRCGGRTQPFEKRRDPCRRAVLGVMLAVVAIIILFGVVCAFVTNEYMEEGIKTLPSKLNTSIDDTERYIKNTVDEFDNLFAKNLLELQSTLNRSLNDASEEIANGLPEVTGTFDNITRFIDGMKTIKNDMQIIKNLTEELKTSSVTLKNRLQSIKQSLEDQLRICVSSKDCEKAASEVSGMEDTTDFAQFLERYFPKLPNITESLSKLENIDSIENILTKGTEEFKRIQTEIDQSISSNRQTFFESMQKAADAIKENSVTIKDTMKNATDLAVGKTRPALDDLDKYIRNYGQYRYYADIAVSTVMLLILLCITLGLFYGFCGKRPDSAYGDDCCNKATGARFLMLGVYVMFIFSAVLMIITLAHFLLGIASEKLVCQSLHHPKDSQLLTVLDEMVPLNIGAKENLNYTTVISSCHQNESIYQVLQVASIVNINKVLNYMEEYKIEDKINQLKQSINIKLDDIELLDSGSADALDTLRNTSLNLTEFSSVLEHGILESNLSELAVTLEETAKKIKGQDPKIAKDLESKAEDLRKLETELVKSMMLQVQVLNETAHALEENMKFNHSSLSEAVDAIKQQLKGTEKYLKESGKDAMDGLVCNFIEKIVQYVRGYLNRVVDKTTSEIGSCGPLSQVYNATLVASCNDILDPFNGFWASIGWCLVLFIPAIILSVKLASLYRKSDPYHPTLPDSEYLYDAYADRDNIPLANGPDKKNHHRRYNETYDNSSGYMGDYSAHLGRGDRDRRERSGTGYHQDDARFNDMAPKYTPLGHWDYSNGALPRYHSPPLSTEYERPPPYYYPGPGDSGRR